MNRLYRRYLQWRLRTLKAKAERLNKTREELVLAAGGARFMEIIWFAVYLEHRAARCAYLEESCLAKALIIATQLDKADPNYLGEWAP